MPPGWMALDGTLFVEDDTPYMVFCHEWVQQIDGTINVVQLKDDLSGTVGTPAVLFKASDPPGASSAPGEGKITDGCFLYRSAKSGRLFMIWSTFIPGRDYCVVLSRSQSGKINGPWADHKLIYAKNGGHGMIFESFGGQLLMALHQPNTEGAERLRLYRVTDSGDILRIGEGLVNRRNRPSSGQNAESPCRSVSKRLILKQIPPCQPLAQDQLDHFATEGYLVAKAVMDPVRTLDPVIEEYTSVLDRLADELYRSGEIRSRYEELNFSDRYIQICIDTGQIHSQFFDFSLPFQGVHLDTPFWAGPAVFGALTDPDLLDAVESLIGPKIYSNPAQHVRIKPPEHHLPKNEYGNPILGPTEWHQDYGVLTAEADDTNVVTAWFSLEDTPIEKGPLMVVPRSHQNGLLPHCNHYMDNRPEFAGGSQIPEKLFADDQAIPLPVERGDVVFLHRETVHGSYSNVSDEVRWSLDLRYNPTDQPTGRSAFPGFVARSRKDPASELRDPAEWHRLWLDARTRMSTVNRERQTEVRFYRPNLDGHNLCA